VWGCLLAGAAGLRSAPGTVCPAVRDTVAGVLDRMKRELSTNELRHLTVARVEQFLTAAEREVLATGHISFHVNVPTRVCVLRDVTLGEEPFWLRARGFRPTGVTLREGRAAFDVWERDFDAGHVGLGIHSLTGSGNHYLVALAPQRPGEQVTVRELAPPQLCLAELRPGVEPYIDQPAVLKSVPPELTGQILIRTDTDLEEAARLVNVFRWTDYPAGDRPDQVILTWSEDPRVTQTIQWRTSTRVATGCVLYQKKAEFHRFSPAPPRRVTAETTRLETPTLLNDPVVHRHTAVLRDLEPGTTYVYSLGDGREEGWTELAEFTTAPAGARPFSFVYLGDAQNGLDRWGTLLRNAFRARPDVAFYLMAGDLVNRGAERNDWDLLFHNAAGVFDRRPLVPALGNHECQGGPPELYRQQLALPRNGPSGLPPERAYAFEYGDALFVVLDSNLDPWSQTNWLAQTLARTRATWKFAVYHHPAYSSGGNRDNPSVRAAWTPLFDQYHVDLVFQGHDHAYLRTYPLRGHQRVASPKEGTVYIIAVSGTKMYPQPAHDYTEVGFTNVATWQVLDLQLSGPRLVYRAYDLDGKARDEFIIEK